MSQTPPGPSWRHELHEVIFEAETPAGKAFDIGLLLCILISILAVILDSVAEIRAEWGGALRGVEWTVTILFTTPGAGRSSELSGTVARHTETGFAIQFLEAHDSLRELVAEAA